MQLRDDIWLEGAYYIDFDPLHQLRVVGPHNHLHYGSAGLYAKDMKVTSTHLFSDGAAKLMIELRGSRLFLPDPVMGPIRKVRWLTELDNEPRPTFAEVRGGHPGALSPTVIMTEGQSIIYHRIYGPHWYGVRLQFNKETVIERVNRKQGFELSSPGSLTFELIAETDQEIAPAMPRVVEAGMPDLSILGRREIKLEKIWQRAGHEITYLIQYNKTSGFDYGTIFPRDWMESVDLAAADLRPAARRYMFQQSLAHVDASGRGWHEDIVGEDRYLEREEIERIEANPDAPHLTAEMRDRLKAVHGDIKQLYISRQMIDIEPRYLMDLDDILSAQPSSDEIEHLRRTAHYVLSQADKNFLITFKRIPEILRHHHSKEFYKAGNWRDSEDAFKTIHPVIAPYDVNVIFYPQALRAIRHHAELLDADLAKIDRLITKWDRVKEWYRFANSDGRSAYALALYDVKPKEGGVEFKKLTVNHTDEAYELFYGEPEEADVVSLCRRLLDPKYFFTPSGPTIVGKQDGYTTTQYHGQVIWTKQTAYIVAGLARQLEASKAKAWSPDSIALLHHTLKATAQTSLDAFAIMDATPELYYDHNGQPRFYTDQPEIRGTMNVVQLWSAVGARRIIREYGKVTEDGHK